MKSQLLVRLFGLFLLTMSASTLFGSNPVITSVSQVTNQSGPTIIIEGSNFGTLPSADLSTTTDTSFLMISGPSLCVGSTCTGTWNAGYTGDACQLTIGSWTDSQIVINAPVSAEGIGIGALGCPLYPGNNLTVQVWNPAKPTGAPASAQAEVVIQGLGPIVSSVSPNYGPQSGGNTVTISGSGFTGATAVWFTTAGSSYLASTFAVDSDTSMTATAPKASLAEGVQVSVASPSGTWQPPVDCVLQTGTGCVAPYFFMAGIFGSHSLTIPMNVSCSDGSSGFSCTSNGVTVGLPPPPGGPGLACMGTPQSPNEDFSVGITGSATIQTNSTAAFGLSSNAGLPSAFIDSGSVTLKSLNLAVSTGGTISETFQMPISFLPPLTPCGADLYLVFSGSVYDGGTFTITAENISLNTNASWIDGQDEIGALPIITCSGAPITSSSVTKCVGLNVQEGVNLDYIQELRFQVGPDDLNAGVGLKVGVSAGDDSKLTPSPLYVDACTDVAWEATAKIPTTPPITESYGGILVGPYNGYASEPDASLDCALGSVAAQTTTTVASSANPSLTGSAVTFTATVSPIPDGGAVGFADNGLTISGCGSTTLSAGNATCTVTYSMAGSHSIVATYMGDSNYLNSTSATLKQVVAVGQTQTTTAVVSSVNPSITGNAVTFTATVSPTPNGGTVDFTDTGVTISGCGAKSLSVGNATCKVTYSSVGSHSIVATYSGDSRYLTSTSPTLTQIVTIGTQTTTTLSSSANPSVARKAVTFTATVSPIPDGGKVDFTDGGSTISGCGAKSLSAGNATCTVTYSMAGSHSIVATYSGDSDYLGSTSPALTQVVTGKGTQTTTTVTSSANPSVAGNTVVFTATVSPAPDGGTVVFTDNGATITGCGASSLSGSNATCAFTYSSSGSHSIVATYSGDTNYLGSTSATLTQVVNAGLTITTPTLPTATVGTPYSATIGISGGTLPYTFSWSGTLPPDLYFFSFATLSGTPSTGGVYSFPVTVSDSSNPVQKVTQTISITVDPITALTVTTTSLPNGTLGTPYSATVQAAGGCPPYTWAAVNLPTGLTLNASSGAISGTPSASGLFGFTISVTDTCYGFAASSYNVSISNPTAVGSGTLTQQFTPTGYLLTAISCVPNSSQVSCWAVGSANGGSTPIILYSANSGQSWSSETPPTGVSGLYSINCPVLNVCYAGTNTGGSAVIMTTDGATWTALTTPTVAPGAGSISCATTSTCFITGGDSLGSSQRIMYTTDGGLNWTVLYTCAFCGQPSVTGNIEFQGQGIFCPTASICYASGTATISGAVSGAVISTTDGGSSWGVTTLAGANQLLDITCTGSTQCWVVGEPTAAQYDYPYVASTADGSDWQVWGPPLTGYSSGGSLIGGIACVNASTCMVTDVLVTQAYSTSDGGGGWLTYPLPNGAGNLAGTSCVSSGECWLVTQGGGIFATLMSSGEDQRKSRAPATNRHNRP